MPIKSKAFNTSAVVTVDGTNNGFYTVNTETTIITSISAHGAETGDFVTFTSSTTAIGGNQDLTGKTFPVSVINVNRFHFQVTVACNATQNKVGTATCKYLLPTSCVLYMVLLYRSCHILGKHQFQLNELELDQKYKQTVRNPYKHLLRL